MIRRPIGFALIVRSAERSSDRSSLARFPSCVLRNSQFFGGQAEAKRPKTAAAQWLDRRPQDDGCSQRRKIPSIFPVKLARQIRQHWAQRTGRSPRRLSEAVSGLVQGLQWMPRRQGLKISWKREAQDTPFFIAPEDDAPTHLFSNCAEEMGIGRTHVHSRWHFLDNS